MTPCSFCRLVYVTKNGFSQGEFAQAQPLSTQLSGDP